MSPSGRTAVLLIMILNFLLLPLTMLLFTFLMFCILGIVFIFELNHSLDYGKRRLKNTNFIMKFLIVLMYLVEIIVVIAGSAGLAVILAGIAIIPAYFVQLYKIFKIINLWLCKSNDKKIHNKDKDKE